MNRKKNPYNTAKKVPSYIVKRTDVDFKWDSSEEHTVGCYHNIKTAETAKVTDMLSCIEVDDFKLTEELKEKTIAVFCGNSEPEEKFIVNGFVVVQDELYLDDPETVAPAYSWEIEKA